MTNSIRPGKPDEPARERWSHCLARGIHRAEG